METKLGYIILYKSSTVRPRYYAGMLYKIEQEAKAASINFDGKSRKDFLEVGKVHYKS